jgi:hypothetical protein
VSGGGCALRWYTCTGVANREGGAEAGEGAGVGPEHGDRHGPLGVVSGNEVLESAPSEEVGAVPGDDGPGLTRELG